MNGMRAGQTARRGFWFPLPQRQNHPLLEFINLRPDKQKPRRAIARRGRKWTTTMPLRTTAE
jgi:hypothetical protein